MNYNCQTFQVKHADKAFLNSWHNLCRSKVALEDVTHLFFGFFFFQASKCRIHNSWLDVASCGAKIFNLRLSRASPELELTPVTLNLKATAHFPNAHLWPPSLKRRHSPQKLPKLWERVGMGYQPRFAPLSIAACGFHSVTTCIKGSESLPTQRCLYTLAATLICALRRHTNYSSLREAPCLRCWNQLTTWSFKNAHCWTPTPKKKVMRRRNRINAIVIYEISCTSLQRKDKQILWVNA